MWTRFSLPAVALLAIACSSAEEKPGQPTSVTLSGAVAKGPFLLGSSVNLSPVDAAAQPTGQSFMTQTNDDAGRFLLQIGYQGPVSIQGSGFYYNEVLGRLSAAPIVLRAYYEISSATDQRAYLNVMTHLAYNRVNTLVQGGAIFSDAASQAQAELIAALGIGGSGFDPGAALTDMNVLEAGTANAYLLVVSSTLAKAAILRDPQAPDAALQELLNTLSVDLGGDGAFESSAQNEVADALEALDPDAILTALAARMAAVGAATEPPDLNLVLDSDGDGVVNADDNCPMRANGDQTDDDGNGVGDVCECGNGRVDYREQCDDGNDDDDDDCSNGCTLGFCSLTGGNAVPCTDDAECADGSICRLGVQLVAGCCVEAGCAAGAGCDPGQLCLDDVCRNLCNTASNCWAGELCVNGVCTLPDQTVCVSNDDCGAGEICYAAVCKRLCIHDSHCSFGEYCSEEGICTAPVSSCTANEQCPAGHVCSAGQCVRLCTIDGDCDAGQVCTGTVCTTPAGACVTNADCQPGRVCIGSLCTLLCARDGDCPIGDICIDGVCMTASSSGPQVDSVDGNGSPDPAAGHAAHRFVDGLVIAGSNLDGATVDLALSGGPTEALVVTSGTDTTIHVTLPAGLAAGEYVLTVSTQAGQENVNLNFLQGEPGEACP